MLSNLTNLNKDLRQHFNQKVYKISLDTGSTCPTRDGTKGSKGCFYCGGTGSHFANPIGGLSITEQLEKGKAFLSKRYKVDKFIAYFQSYTSTYTQVEVLESKLQEAIAVSDIVGLSLATRPDCLADDCLKMLSKYMLSRYHWLELGLESGHNLTLEKIGRGHTYEDFLDTYRRAKVLGFRICVHIILGLPGETEEMMLDTVKRLVELEVDGLKFHNLHIVKNSVYEEEYKKGNIKLYSMVEYKDLLLKIAPLLNKKIVVHRLMGDAPASELVAPDWVLDKQRALAYLHI
ncbi:TIGR01212 family radical SAM protein [Candidatus Margulisiibacteriota bacterium]